MVNDRDKLRAAGVRSAKKPGSRRRHHYACWTISQLSYQYLAVWLMVSIPADQCDVAFVFKNKF